MSTSQGGAGRARGRGKRPDASSSESILPSGSGISSQINPRTTSSTSSDPSTCAGIVTGTSIRPAIALQPLSHAQYSVPSDVNRLMSSDTSRGPLRGKKISPPKIHTSKIVAKTGNTGDPVTIHANYFQLIRKPMWTIYQYRVDFEPNIELVSLRRYLLAQQKEYLGGYLFDGATLFLIRQLEDGDEVTNRIIEGRTGDKYNVIFTYTRAVAQTDAESLHVLNIILRRAMSGLKLQLVNRNFFDPDNKIVINELKLELWPGYVTSIRQHERDILVCIDFIFKAMRMETIYDIMSRLRREERDFKSAIERDIIGTTILTSYTNKTYFIDDIDYTKKPSDTFETKNGPISFVQYYQERYHINIRDVNQPLLVSKAKAKDLRGGQSDLILLIPELCRATGFTEKMRSDHRNMRLVADHTRANPGVRISRLAQFNRRLHGMNESIEVFRQWDLQLDNKLVEIPGRQLPYEKIIFGNGNKRATDSRADWTNEFRNNTMYVSKDGLRRWFVIATNRMSQQAQAFVLLMKRAAQGMQFNLGDPRFLELADDRQNTYVNALKEAANQNPQFIMCVVPNDNADRYANIKKQGCIVLGIPTQVMLIKTITPKPGKPPSSVLSVATKVVIQINCKLGGSPWMIELPIKGLMTIGFDVCHDVKDKRRAFGAMVATMDLTQSTQIFSTVTAHTNDEELSNEFSLSVVKAINEFRELHSALPSRICIYRDGVGDGQIKFVQEHEISNIRNILEGIYEKAGVKDALKFAFIIVNKRINTRLFKLNANPNPGTVVDSVITLPERYDFFLISQSVTQGSVAPTSFNVLYDTMGLPADKIQILTYKMCHLYYNWSGTIRVPAVCQYAHKLAFLVSQYIHAEPNNVLQKQLYFL